jgi:hypothetical protein
MDEILRYLVNYQAWIYAGLGIGGLIFLRRVLQATHEWRGASFGLEKENARYRFSISMTVLLVFFILAGIEFFMVSFFEPSRERSTFLATPTIDLLATSTATLPVGTKPAVTPTGPVITQTPVITEGCTPGVIEWTFPKNGGELKGTVELRGTVTVPNLGFYKYEYSPVGSDVWTTIAAGNNNEATPVSHINKLLGGKWDTTQVGATGDFRLRLVVTDNQNKVLPACVINIKITAP